MRHCAYTVRIDMRWQQSSKVLCAACRTPQCAICALGAYRVHTLCVSAAHWLPEFTQYIFLRLTSVHRALSQHNQDNNPQRFYSVSSVKQMKSSVVIRCLELCGAAEKANRVELKYIKKKL